MFYLWNDHVRHSTDAIFRGNLANYVLCRDSNTDCSGINNADCFDLLVGFTDPSDRSLNSVLNVLVPSYAAGFNECSINGTYPVGKSYDCIVNSATGELLVNQNGMFVYDAYANGQGYEGLYSIGIIIGFFGTVIVIVLMICLISSKCYCCF